MPPPAGAAKIQLLVDSALLQDVQIGKIAG
jgi:hypothetical protein